MKILANPSSRAGRGRKTWPSWRQSLEAEGLEYIWHVCASAEDCERQAALGDDSLVAAAGGDGTINGVINGLMAAGRPASLAVLYCGTSPDFCRFHRIPTEAAAAIRLLSKGRARQVDLAEIYLSRNGKLDKRYFADSCNIGLGSAVAAFANRWRRYLGDALGTGLGLMKTMLSHRPYSASLRLDGEEFNFSSVNHIIILKNPYIASGLRLNADLDRDDGRLLAVVIHDHSRPALIKTLRSLYNGGLIGRPNVFGRYCREVEVRTENRQSVEFDGDPQGHTPVKINCLPRSLTLICGEEDERS